MWSRDDLSNKNTPDEPRGVNDSPRDVQRVKGHGRGNGPSSLTRRATCSREVRLATLNESNDASAVCRARQPGTKTGKTKLNYVPGSWENEKSALRSSQNGIYPIVANATAALPTCNVFTH